MMNKRASMILIDDDPFTMAMTRAVVKKTMPDSQIRTFYSAEEALSYLQTENVASETGMSEPGVILSDLNMPNMDGFQFLDEFAKLPWAIQSRYSVFILSSTTDDKERSQLPKKSAFSGFYPKPLTPVKFRNLMSRVSGLLLAF